MADAETSMSGNIAQADCSYPAGVQTLQSSQQLCSIVVQIHCSLFLEVFKMSVLKALGPLDPVSHPQHLTQVINLTVFAKAFCRTLWDLYINMMQNSLWDRNLQQSGSSANFPFNNQLKSST